MGSELPAAGRPMRLLVVETAPRSGLLHYTSQLADALAGGGHEVDLLVPRGNELAGRPSRARLRPVLAAYRGSTRGEPSNRAAYTLRRVRVGAAVTLAWARIVWEAARGGHHAVVLGSDISHSVGAGAMVMMTRLRRPKVVFICHNVRPFNRWAGDDPFQSRGRAMRRIGRVYSRCDLVVVHGESSRAEFEAVWAPVRPGVIPHGDERLFGDEPPAPAADERVLFFGDLRKVKGLPVLMDAFEKLSQDRPAARLTIAGTPAPMDFDVEGLRRWAGERSERVELIDHYIPLEQVAALFARARVVVTPYLVGYQSGVVHLAMTMARAVVTSDVGDLKTTVVDGETGFVVPAGDAAALAAALDKVLGDPELAARMGSAGRQRLMDRSSWEAVAAALEAQIRDIL